MSTTAPAQLDPTSLDLSGISVATAAPSENPRTGAAYDPALLAAAAPLWFHPMPGRGHLMVTTRAWTAASPGGGAGVFTDYAEATEPSWFVLDGLTGKRNFVPGYSAAVPVNTVTTARALTAAASRAPDYLYLLHAATIAGEAQALLQHFRVATGGVRIYTEEVVPTVALAEDNIVVFDKGLQYQTPYLYFYGTNTAGQVYQVRKKWAEIGTNQRQASGYTPSWEYFTGTGFASEAELRFTWGEDWIDHIVPMTGITSDGPLSFAAFRNIVVMSTVLRTRPSTLPDVTFTGTGTLSTTGVAASDDYVGQLWQSRQGRPFQRVGDPIPLGSPNDGSYLGHGLMLQSQLETNPAVLPAGFSGGIPYLVTTKSSVDGEDALINTWGLHTIRL